MQMKTTSWSTAEWILRPAHLEVIKLLIWACQEALNYKGWSHMSTVFVFSALPPRNKYAYLDIYNNINREERSPHGQTKWCLWGIKVHVEVQHVVHVHCWCCTRIITWLIKYFQYCMGKHLILSCYLLFDKSQPFEVCQTNTFYQFFMLWFTFQRSDLRTTPTPQNTVFPAKVCVFLLSPLLNCHQNLQFFYLPAIHALLVCIFGFNTDTKWRNQSDFSCGIKVCKDNSRIQVNFELIKLENILSLSFLMLVFSTDSGKTLA